MQTAAYQGGQMSYGPVQSSWCDKACIPGRSQKSFQKTSAGVSSRQVSKPPNSLSKFPHKPLRACIHDCRNAGGSKASAEQAAKRFQAISEAYEVLGNGKAILVMHRHALCMLNECIELL